MTKTLAPYKVSGICWDTDGEDVDLPDEVVVVTTDEDEIIDKISNYYGWCIFGASYERFCPDGLDPADPMYDLPII